MVSPNRQWDNDAEARVIEKLKSAYEEQGFSFFAPPETGMIPSFLGNYMPGAIAIKNGNHVLIEVKLKQNFASDRMLSDLRRKISGHKGWKLNVVYAVESQEDKTIVEIPTATMLDDMIAEARTLLATGHSVAAFVLAWSLLEAVLNFKNQTVSKGQPRSPGQVVQSLSMNGHVDSETEKSLRNLLDLRSRVVHGDLSVKVSSENVQSVLDAVDNALSV